MAFKNARFEVGELIVVTTRLRNVGAVPITIAVSSRATGRYDGYHFTVADVNGRPAADPGAGAIEGLNSPVGFVTIAPGRVYTRDMPLNYHMAPLEPGRYVVRGVFAGSFPQVGAESIERTFDIVATSPAQRRTRVAQLAGELERGADPNRVAPLLGFTGDPSARAPLIDLLYASDDGVRASAADALLFLDHEQVVRSLLDAIRTRGPHNRLLDFLSGSPDVVPAEVIGVLSPWLRSTNQESRAAAVKGLRFFNEPPSRDLFGPLAALLKDPVPAVRHEAAAAIGIYGDNAALDALRPMVRDSDPHVSVQATIAVGWIAEASSSGAATRAGAIEVLRAVARTDGAAREQAIDWLSKVDPR